MNTSINQIMDRLGEVFAPMDSKVLEDSQTWAKGRVAALQEFKSSEEYKTLRRNQYAFYEKLHRIAGGKTWYNIFDGRNAEMIEELILKNHNATITKRNSSIAAKLTKAGVTEIISEEFGYTKDGFNGVFVVNTDAGKKRVKIETIYAGGYNIQCLHLRVLVTVK